MICPYCKNEMEKGYLYSDGAIKWKEGDKKPGIMNNIFSPHQLSAAQFRLPNMQTVEANYCPACAKIIIETSVK